MDPEVDVERIVDECVAVMVGSTGRVGVSREALGYWRLRYRLRFEAALDRDPTLSWERDRPNVFRKTRRLGRLAARLALRAGLTEISAAHAHAASEQADCRPSAERVRKGIWCIPPGPQPGPDGPERHPEAIGLRAGVALARSR